MNHLRELIEQWPEGGRGTEAVLRAVASQAMCFWAGDVEDILKLEPIPAICRPPFPVSWVEGSSISKATGSVAFLGLLTVSSSNVPEHDVVGAFVKVHGEWDFLGSALVLWGGIEEGGDDGDEAVLGVHGTALMNAALCMARRFWSALGCTNVERQEHFPSDALQKARAKRGKAPLFSYWTLQLNGRSEKGPYLGGTHASPRVHLRRGHARQFAPGRYTWVQPHAVGNVKAGIVHKDYAAGPTLLHAGQPQQVA
jgi:hypothetical protein